MLIPIFSCYVERFLYILHHHRYASQILHPLTQEGNMYTLLNTKLLLNWIAFELRTINGRNLAGTYAYRLENWLGLLQGKQTQKGLGNQRSMIRLLFFESREEPRQFLDDQWRSLKSKYDTPYANEVNRTFQECWPDVRIRGTTCYEL